MKKKKMRFFILVSTVLFILFGLFLFHVFTKNKIAVLTYHNIYKEDTEYQGDDIFILKLDKFEEQLAYLKHHHYKTLTLDEFYCYKEKTCKQPKKSVLITFDDGFYFNYKYAFPLLKKYDMKATIFVTGKYIEVGQPDNLDVKSLMNMEILNSMKSEFPNITIASHSYDLHGNRTIDMLTKEEIEEDFAKMNNIIHTDYFAYPFGIYNSEAFEVLKENNFKLAFGFGKDNNNKRKHRKASLYDNDYLIPRFNIYATLPMWKFKLYLILP